MIEAETITLKKRGSLLQHRLPRKYFPLVHEDLTAVYSRDLRKWLIIAPLIGVLTGLMATAIVVIILNEMWPTLLSFFDVSEAARLLLSENRQMMLLVVGDDGSMKGIVTKADILKVLKLRREAPLELSGAVIN